LRFEMPETFKEPANSEATFKTVTLAKVAVKLVVRDAKLEIEMTFRVPTLAKGVITYPPAVRFVVSDAKFEIVKTLSVETFATEAMRLVVRLAKFETEMTLSVLRLRVDKFETEMTLRTDALTEAAKSVETFAVPKT